MSPEAVMTTDDLAAAWFARQRAGDMTAAETAELDAWLDADPEHRAALDALARAWDRAELARHDPEILAWRERALRRQSWFQRLRARYIYGPQLHAGPFAATALTVMPSLTRRAA